MTDYGHEIEFGFFLDPTESERVAARRAGQ